MSDLAPEEAFPEPRRWTLKLNRAVRNALAGKAGLLCAAAVLFAAGWAYSVDWGQVSAALATERPAYPYDPAVLAEAKSLALDYDSVATDPSKYAGKPVLWCLVKQSGTERPFVNGNMSWVVNMQGGAIESVPTGRMGVCKPTLAVIEKTAAPGVNLTFVAHL
ncbi:MAG: hypothetical protein SF051_10195 [Elusimicrobiota bacterium]|nr:hypothetical protein [Elusimicrobiota bacterium]